MQDVEGEPMLTATYNYLALVIYLFESPKVLLECKRNLSFWHRCIRMLLEQAVIRAHTTGSIQQITNAHCPVDTTTCNRSLDN